MIRQIIHIDEALCNGCGRCAQACHEGAIAMVNGKARLIADDYCDGLGDCLPQCPTGAITFETREAAPYDEAAVQAARKTPHPHGGCPGSHAQALHPHGGCPGSQTQTLHPHGGCPGSQAEALHPHGGCPGSQTQTLHPHGGPDTPQPSELRQWPVQIKLAPVNAPFYAGAHLLIAADCTAFACGDFHRRCMAGRITLIGCPKLDAVDYREKLTAILSRNPVASVTVARMEVPCCGGLERAVEDAMAAAGCTAPLSVITFTTRGEVLA